MVTGQAVLCTAGEVFAAPAPRGWRDCALAVDALHRRLFGRGFLGEFAQAYRTPQEALRLIRRAGGWAPLFADVVARGGLRPVAPRAGAVGWLPVADGAFGHVTAMMITPGRWVVPSDIGATVLNGTSETWGL
jgi:hypothetical protein